MKKKTCLIAAIVLVTVSLAVPGTGQAWRGHHGHHRGWYGPGLFAGGFLLGAAVAPRYYYYPYYPPPVYAYPPPAAVYMPPPAYAYPDPAYPSNPSRAGSAPSSGQASAGQWVDVPGQMVNGVWVPGHKAWVPDVE